MPKAHGRTGTPEVKPSAHGRQSGTLPGDSELPAGSQDITSTTTEEIDPSEVPLGPQNAGAEPPRSGTVDDDDNRDDEREDENEAPTREARDTQEAREEFRLDEREENPVLPPDASKTAMAIQSQDIEKQRPARQNGTRPDEAPTPPHDSPPGQPHDPPAQPGEDDRVGRVPTRESSDEESQEQTGRRKPQPRK